MRKFHLVSFIMDVHYLCSGVSVFIFVCFVFNPSVSRACRLIAFTVIALLLMLSKIERHFIFTDEDVLIYSCVHDAQTSAYLSGEPIPASIEQLLKYTPSPRRCFFRRRVLKEKMQRVALYFIKSWGVVVIELKGCKPRHERTTLQFLLHNRKRILCVFADLEVAIRYHSVIETYLTGSMTDE